MSIQINIDLVCDGCGAKITRPTEHRTTRVAALLWELRVLAVRDKWTGVNRGRFLPKAHYCQTCSDKPMKPIPKPHRPRLVLTAADACAIDLL